MSIYLLSLLIVFAAGFFSLSFFFRERKIFLYAAIAFLFVFLIFWRLALVQKNLPLEEFIGQKITLSGVVKDIPDRRINNTLLTLETSDQKTRVLVSTDVFPDYRYGDTVAVSGVLRKPENFETDTGRIFDYENYLARKGIYYRMIHPEIELLDRGGGFFLKRWLFSLRETFERSLLKILPYSHAGLLSGILLGVQGGMPSELKENFVRTGLIHIVALSGYNITIVAETIMRFFGFLSLRRRIILGGGVIVLFIIMTGVQSTAVRAGLMAGIALIGRFLGRPYAAIRGLFAAGFLMFLWNPLVIYDPGFALSILATFGLIYLSPKIKPWFRFVAAKKFSVEWRELVAATIATQFFVFPYLLWKMGTVSLVAPVANLLVLPIIPFLMLVGFLTGFAAIFWRPTALPFGFVSFLLLGFIFFVSNAFGNLPFAAATAAVWPGWATLLLYALIFLGAWRLRSSSQSLPSSN